MLEKKNDIKAILIRFTLLNNIKLTKTNIGNVLLLKLSKILNLDRSFKGFFFFILFWIFIFLFSQFAIWKSPLIHLSCLKLYVLYLLG